MNDPKTRRKVVIILLFVLTIVVIIGAIYVGSRLSQQPTVTPEEQAALPPGSLCSSAADCDGETCEWPTTAFCTSNNSGNPSRCECRLCDQQRCVNGQVENPPGCVVNLPACTSGTPSCPTLPTCPANLPIKCGDSIECNGSGGACSGCTDIGSVVCSSPGCSNETAIHVYCRAGGTTPPVTTPPPSGGCPDNRPRFRLNYNPPCPNTPQIGRATECDKGWLDGAPGMPLSNILEFQFAVFRNDQLQSFTNGTTRLYRNGSLLNTITGGAPTDISQAPQSGDTFTLRFFNPSDANEECGSTTITFAAGPTTTTPTPPVTTVMPSTVTPTPTPQNGYVLSKSGSQVCDDTAEFSTVTYSILATNINATQVTVTIQDDLDDAIQDDWIVAGSISNGGVVANNVITWPNITIPANSSVTLTYQVRIPRSSFGSAGRTYNNVVTLSENGQPRATAQYSIEVGCLTPTALISDEVDRIILGIALILFGLLIYRFKLNETLGQLFWNTYSKVFDKETKIKEQNLKHQKQNQKFEHHIKDKIRE